jgi:hypothetical protein
VENRLLSGALLDRKNYRVLAAEFVRMREYRRAKLSEELLAFEKEQERIEGTAEYVCWKGIARRFSPLLAENYHAGMLLSPQPLANRDRRYYSPGAAQGFLLDRAGVSWQGRVQNGADISEIMRESFPPHHGVRDVKALLREFYSKWVQNALNIQASELAAKQRRVLDSLEKYAGWKLVFRNDSDCNGQSRTCYDEDIDLGNGRTYLEACHIELRCKGVDISIDKAAIQGGRETTVLLGDNPRLSVKVDGTLRNPVPQSAAYHQLSIRAEGLMLDLARKGRINTSGNTIYVIPDPVNK